MDAETLAIKQQIAASRNRIGDTLEALAYKTDVRARAQDAVNERVDTIKGKISDAVSSARDAATTVSEALPTSDELAAHFSTARSAIARNPVGLAIGSIAIGLLVGSFFPVRGRKE